MSGSGPGGGPAHPGGAIRRVDQFVPALAAHDAIGNHVLQLRRTLEAAGYESAIFYEYLDPRVASDARHFRECDPRPDPSRLILYHASTHSAMAGWLREAAGAGQQVAIDYHNITPSEYFARWDANAARSMDQARRQLAELLPHVALAVADSSYNEQELRDLGHRRTGVCPLLLDLEEMHATADPAVSARVRDLREEGPVWIFVGRLAPNKCQHDVIAAFAVYQRLFHPGAHLALVGGATSPRYQRALGVMATELGVADRVHFVGSAPFPQMLAWYHEADVFVCLSEHEGFCVPVIEAMEVGVPVVAHRAAAVGETVSQAGVLVEDKDPLEVAAAVDSLLGDPARREALVAAGRQRASCFSKETAERVWLKEVRGFAVGGSPTL